MKDLTKGNPGKLILQFAIPIFIGNLVQLFYSLVDIRIVGEILGEQALAAVGATNTLNNLIIGFLIGLTNGFAIIVARDFGAGDFEALRKSVAGTLSLGMITAIILTIVSVGLLEPILRLLNMKDELMLQGILYIRVILLGMMAAMLYNVCASVLRAIGDAITPLYFLVLSALMNIGLDYLLVGPMNQGVAGAAYATVISQSIAAILCFIYIVKRYPMLHLRWSDFRPQKSRIVLLLKSGLSMGMMQSLVSLGTVALQSAINTFSTNIIVAHTGARKITEMLMLPFSVLGMTIATYCGQNRGAGEIQRIKIGIKQVILAAWGWCVVVIIISYTLSPLLIQMVTASKEVEVIETATLYLRVDTLLYFVTAMIAVFRNALQGLGDHTTPIFSSFIELIGKVLVVILLVPSLGYMGIIVAEPIVWVLMVIPLIIQLVRHPLFKENVNLKENSKIM